MIIMPMFDIIWMVLGWYMSFVKKQINSFVFFGSYFRGVNMVIMSMFLRSRMMMLYPQEPHLPVKK